MALRLVAATACFGAVVGGGVFHTRSRSRAPGTANAASSNRRGVARSAAPAADAASPASGAGAGSSGSVRGRAARGAPAAGGGAAGAASPAAGGASAASRAAGAGAGRAARAGVGANGVVNVWPAEHADASNAGRVAAPGPVSAFAQGFYRDYWVSYNFEAMVDAETVGSTAGAYQAHSGVSSTADNNYPGSYFFGDMNGTAYLLADTTGFNEVITDVYVPNLFGSQASRTGFVGFYAAPAATFDNVSTPCATPGVPGTCGDLIVMPSLDGNIYVLRQTACNIEDAAGCAFWRFSSPVTGNSFTGSPRVLRSPALNGGKGVVYVTEFNLNNNVLNPDSAGLLRALSLVDGSETVWPVPFQAMHPQVTGNTYPLIGVTPALSPLPGVDDELVLAFGPAVYLISARSGEVVTFADIRNPSGACPAAEAGEILTSSPSVLAASSGNATWAWVFVQSSFSNMWVFNISVAPGSLSFERAITCARACGYRPGSTACGLPLTTGPTFATWDAYARSTPAVSSDGAFVAMTTTADPGATAPAGVVVAAVADGTLPQPGWSVSSFGDVGDDVIVYARSRAAPAWDGFDAANGYSYLYVAAEVVWGLNSVSVPVLTVFRVRAGAAAPVFIWGAELTGMGYYPYSGALRGLARPVLMDAPGTDGDPTVTPRVVMAGTNGSIHSFYGQLDTCPTANPVLECSGNGDCLIDGSCFCRGPWRGGTPSCSVNTGCGNGTVVDGSCACSPCWTEGGISGKCDTPYDCLNGGRCEALLPGPGAVCSCPGCFKPDPATGDCTVPRDCGPGSVGCSNSTCICASCYTLASDGNSCVPQDCGPGAEECIPSATPGAPGNCTCAPCYSLDAGGTCSVFKTCGEGSCDAGSGACVCDACFSLDGAGQCSVEKDCGNGQCNIATSACTCDACWENEGGVPAAACTQPRDCGPGGVCDAGANTCDSNGNKCYTQDPVTRAWDVAKSCSQHGSCLPATGACFCDAGWSNLTIPAPCAACDACHSDGACSLVFGCSGHGTCVLAGVAQTRTCACRDGFSGPTCAVAPPAPNADAGAGASAPVIGGAVGGVLAALVAMGLYVRAGGALPSLGGATKGFVAFGGGGSSASSSSSSSLGKGLSGRGGATGEAPATIAAISKSAGLGGDGAAAAVARLGSLGGAAKPAASERASLLGSQRATAKPTGPAVFGRV